MIKKLLIILILLIPSVSASTSNINIQISNDDIVSENFELSVDFLEQYDTFTFYSVKKPLSVNYKNDYQIQKMADAYTILFDNKLNENKVSFDLIYDDYIEKSENNKIFRSNFAFFNQTNISLSLPKNAILSGNPSSTPEPDKIITDGERITLFWNFNNEEPSIIVFYKQEKNNISIILLFVMVIILVLSTSAIFLYSKSKIKKIVEDTLTEDEKLILEEVRKGNIKQKDIAKKLEFSKSKMSKVVRKLEEKDLISKEPHFKTYKIKIKKIK